MTTPQQYEVYLKDITGKHLSVEQEAYFPDDFESFIAYIKVWEEGYDGKWDVPRDAPVVITVNRSTRHAMLRACPTTNWRNLRRALKKRDTSNVIPMPVAGGVR